MLQCCGRIHHQGKLGARIAAFDNVSFKQDAADNWVDNVDCYTPLTGNKEGGKGLMVLCVRPTPLRFLISSPTSLIPC